MLRWAFIPAIALLAIATVIAAAATDLVNYIWPAAIIVAGVLLLVQAFWRRS
jgi:hypothetical protein